MNGRSRTKDRRDERGDQLPALLALFEENVVFYHRLTALAEKMHGKGALSGPRRTILVGLARSGPRTVAQMARDRSQARQRFQPLVNGLIDEGLLEAVANPAHKQSPLIALTRKGRRALERIHRIEEAWRPRLKLDAANAKLADTTAVLREVRQEIERLIREE
jgi:DNA-binding MarR family transcriptional regulator